MCFARQVTILATTAMSSRETARMLLQRIMAAGAMEEQQVTKLARRLTGEDIPNSAVDEMVAAIAASIRPFALDIRRGMYDDGKMYLAVVNTSHDALTAFSSGYKPWEIVFLRKAMEEIIDSEEGALEESELYNLRDNTSIGEVSDLMRRLTAERWLAPSAVQLPSPALTLGPRAFLELIAFLRDLEVKKCPICTFEMLQGLKCREGRCDTVVHVGCVETFERNGRKYSCPKCTKPIRR